MKPIFSAAVPTAPHLPLVLSELSQRVFYYQRCNNWYYYCFTTLLLLTLLTYYYLLLVPYLSLASILLLVVVVVALILLLLVPTSFYRILLCIDNTVQTHGHASKAHFISALLLVVVVVLLVFTLFSRFLVKSFTVSFQCFGNAAHAHASCH